MHKKGFTFLELLIAISLFAVGMLSLLQVFPINRRFLQQSSMTTQAAFLAQEQVEKLYSVPYANLAVQASGTGTYETRAPVSATGQFSQFERETIVTLINPNNGDPDMSDRHNTSTVDYGLKKIDVKVYWMEKNVPRNYVLSTYINKH